MISYEELVERLTEKCGNNKQRASAKVVELAYEVMAESEGEKILVDRMCLERKVAELTKETTKLQSDVARYTTEKNFLKTKVDEYKKQKDDLNYAVEKRVKNVRLEEMYKLKDEIDKAIENINNGETPEGRDVLRAAQYYVNSVRVDTKYDNTAFIAGLAAILSKGRINPLGELKKINPEIADSIIEKEEDKIFCFYDNEYVRKKTV